MKIIAEAPCRVDLAGGTLDIWPLFLFHPGAVTLNFAIDRWTRCVISTNPASSEIRLRSGDLEAEEAFQSLDELLAAPRPKLPLAAQVLRFFRLRTGLLVHTDSEAPAGAGISGSSALIIAMVSGMNRLAGTRYGLEKIREIAQNIEAQILRVPTGV
jgi:D-glycero-alpha-D-manno-heptose-7-phosphate kinase